MNDAIATTAIDAGVALAQSNVESIRESLAGLEAKIEALDPQIATLNTSIKGDWRNAAGNAGNLVHAQEDLERLLRQRKLHRDAQDAGQLELNRAERQVVAARVRAVGAEYDRVASGATTKSRNVMAVLYQLAAMIRELDYDTDTARRLFSASREQTGLTVNDVSMLTGKVRFADYVEEILAAELGNVLWPDAINRRPAGFESRFATVIDAERQGVLNAMNRFLDSLNAAPPELAVVDAIDSITRKQYGLT